MLVMLSLVVGFAACGGDNDDTTEAKSGDPQGVFDKATLEGIESGQMDLTFKNTTAGGESSDLDLRISGPFRTTENGPEFNVSVAMNTRLEGESIDYDGGVISRSDTAYLKVGTATYRLRPVALEGITSMIETSTSSACEKIASERGLSIEDFVIGLSAEGTADVGGTTTTKFSGGLDTDKALDFFVEVFEFPGCRTQIEGSELSNVFFSALSPVEAAENLRSSLGPVRIDAYVGTDNIIRRISIVGTIEPVNPGSGPTSAELSLDLTLTEVNEDQQIEKPKNAPLVGSLPGTSQDNPLLVFLALRTTSEKLLR
jgi:hypothetical protein